MVDDSNIIIRSQEPEQLYPFKSYAIYIDKIPKEYEISKELMCFKHNKDLLCEEDSGAFIMFEQVLNALCWGTENIAYWKVSSIGLGILEQTSMQAFLI